MNVINQSPDKLDDLMHKLDNALCIIGLIIGELEILLEEFKKP